MLEPSVPVGQEMTKVQRCRAENASGTLRDATTITLFTNHDLCLFLFLFLYHLFRPCFLA